MVGFGPLLPEGTGIGELLRDADGHVRGALLCWAVAVASFVILRASRPVLLACLLVAAGSVGLAALILDAAPQRAAASAMPSVPAERPHALPSRAGGFASHRFGEQSDR